MISLINGISAIIDFIRDGLDQLIEFFNLMSDSVVLVSDLFEILPSYLLYPCGAVLTILVVRVLLPGGG